MERGSERDRGSRKSSKDYDRIRERESSRDHHRDYDRDRDRDQKQRHHHRSSKISGEKRHQEDDRRHRTRELTPSDTEADRDTHRERSSSRARDSADRELSEERRHSSKRKEYWDEEDLEKNGKRARILDEEREGKRERRRFEDHKEEKRDAKSSKSRKREENYKDRDEVKQDGKVKDDILSDGDDKKRPQKGGRKFTDTMKAEKKEVKLQYELLNVKEVMDERISKDKPKEETPESDQEVRYVL